MQKSFVFYLIVLLGLSTCTFSTQQEMQLNKDLSNFILVRNEGDALSYLNFTHPLIVNHYKDLGDSIFKKKFQEVPKKEEQNLTKKEIVYWNKGYIKSAKSNDSLIQAKVEITLFQKNKALDSTTVLYAISTQQSKNWLFIHQEDYLTVFPKTYRLFSEYRESQ